MKPLMTSLDLFSGVGGITRALEGFTKPIAYCEIDPYCQQVLRRQMTQGTLARAPILEDVRHVNAKVLKASRVDVIVGGWPCQDLSSMGLKKGLEGKRSGLIYEVFRLTDELKPKMLFLENVPMILKNGFDVLVKEFVQKRGYELRWAVIPASAVGALHVRKRWFCLLIKKGAKIPAVWKGKPGYKPFFQQPQNLQEPPRMIVVPDKKERSEMHRRAWMMGNSVVPDAVRLAFLTLIGGFRTVQGCSTAQHTTTHLLGIPVSVKTVPLQYLQASPMQASLIPSSWGYISPESPSILYKVNRPKMAKPKLKLTFDPRLYKAHAKGAVTSDLLTKPVKRIVWNTPRHTSHTSNVMTMRALRDLPSQVRFEVNTPNHLRKGIIHPQFVEWLMGYPRDYTVA
jgi:site-specific DNA-cytosine methylase